MRINSSGKKAREQNCLINLDESNVEPGPIFNEPNTASYKKTIAELSGINFHVSAEAYTASSTATGKRPLPNLLPINIQKRQEANMFPTVVKTMPFFDILNQLYLINVEPYKITLNIENLVDLCGSDFGCLTYE